MENVYKQEMYTSITDQELETSGNVGTISK